MYWYDKAQRPTRMVWGRQVRTLVGLERSEYDPAGKTGERTIPIWTACSMAEAETIAAQAQTRPDILRTWIETIGAAPAIDVEGVRMQTEHEEDRCGNSFSRANRAVTSWSHAAMMHRHYCARLPLVDGR